jgi:hypothetical protein
VPREVETGCWYPFNKLGLAPDPDADAETDAEADVKVEDG